MAESVGGADMGKIKLFLGASILLLVSGQVNAGIINIANTNTEYDTGKFADLQGLNWLTLDETQNQSRQSVLDGFGGYIDNGWRYATRNETETLVNSIWGGEISSA